MSNKDLRFETLQIHAGQETQIQQQEQEQFQSIRQHRMYLIIQHMRQRDLD